MTTKTIGFVRLAMTLPIYARSEANNRDSRFAKAARTKQQRGITRAMVNGNAGGMLALLNSIAPGAKIAVILCRLHRRSARPLDDDNLRGSLKAVRDGVADALHLDDADPRLTWLYEQAPADDYAVRIEIDGGSR